MGGIPNSPGESAYLMPGAHISRLLSLFRLKGFRLVGLNHRLGSMVEEAGDVLGPADLILREQLAGPLPRDLDLISDGLRNRREFAPAGHSGVTSVGFR